jgi:Ca2+-binding EF-hand superfamily protein
MKDGLKQGIGFYRDPSQLSGAMKNQVPEGYKGYYDKLESGANKVAELKRQADEMKLQMIEKVLDPLIAQVDENQDGQLQKAECENLVKKAMTKLDKSEMWNQTAFDQLFNQFDTNKTGILSKRKLAELVNFMAFGGL